MHVLVGSCFVNCLARLGTVMLWCNHIPLHMVYPKLTSCGHGLPFEGSMNQQHCKILTSCRPWPQLAATMEQNCSTFTFILLFMRSQQADELKIATLVGFYDCAR